jgi:tetratricopeptide (TPR) repeat protein
MKKVFLFFILAYILTGSGCKKFLTEKPDTKLAIPTTLADFQALLDRYPVINTSDPCSGEISADNYFLTTTDYLALTQDNFRRMYSWQKDALFVPQSNEWYTTYRPVFTANTILEGLENRSLADADLYTYRNVRGQALYARAKSFLQAAGIWTKAYDPNTASADPGIPMRLGTDFNGATVRSSLQDTYNQILSDLQAAASLLPVIPLQVIRPSRPAAFALLARTYLIMGQYDKAALYADSCLQLYNTLIDYNQLKATLAYPITRFNLEVIQESSMVTSAPISNVRARIDSTLYLSYDANDLRKTIFFKSSTNGTYVFRGSYEGGVSLFDGVATDEVYLTRAEAYARTGQIAQAINDLNTLLAKRYKAGTFTPINVSTASDALAVILKERRMELLMRGLRWFDLKRLNKEGAGILLNRNVNGQLYTLAPNDPRYALPIPDDIIQMTGIPQNPR